VNAAALRLCGATALDEMWGKTLSQFLPPDEQEPVHQFCQRLLEGDAVSLRETRVWRLDAREVPVEVAGSRVEWLGRPAVQATWRDITERKRIERELQEAREQLVRANTSLEQTVRVRTAELRKTIEDLHQFSYAMMHDMRAPLRAMHSFATLMENECTAAKVTHGVEYLTRIKSAAGRLDNLVRDALNYSRVLQERLPLVPVDLGQLLQGIIESYPDLQPAVADISIEGPLPVVLGSEAALTQCFSNLLDNAVKFVAPGIRPRIRVWASPGAYAQEPQGSWVRIVVQDNGIGIAPENQAHIFEMFQRLNQGFEGTGIGLAIVRKALERLGGRVGVESVLGEGSKFWMELRRAGHSLSNSEILSNSEMEPEVSEPSKGERHGASAQDRASRA
jgi:PAS domain S-box-containing protein